MRKVTCDRNCEKCRFKDCIMNDLTLEEYAFSKQLDKEVIEESTIHDYGVGSRQNRKPYDVKYFSTHKKEHLQRCKEYRDTHKEERKELYKKYYENNKEEIKERQSLAMATILRPMVLCGCMFSMVSTLDLFQRSS